MKPGGDQDMNGGRGDPHLTDLFKEGRQDEKVRDRPGFITDGNRHGPDPLKIPEPFPAERILDAPEDLLLGIGRDRNRIGLEKIRLPARREIEGYLSFSVREFQVGCHVMSRA
jgi:hypothetical protein